MSYILEALKKSEQERRRGDVPDLQTLHMPMPAPTRSHAWLYGIIVALVLALGFVLGMVAPWKSEPSVVAVPAADTRVTPVPVALSDVRPPPVVEEAMPVAAEELQAATAESLAQAQPSVSESPTPVPSLDMDSLPFLADLPPLVQQAIPGMSFAGHVYSTNPAQRSVIINGQAMGEGDAIMHNLRLEQITRSGVVFNFEGRLFRMEILQDWSFN